MRKYIVNFLKLAISLGIGIGIVYLFVGKMSDSEKQEVIADIKRANYLWVIMPVVLGLISNYFRTQRWRLLLRPLGYNPSLFNTFFSVMIMYFLNLFFPRLGEVSRCGVLSRYENVPMDKAIGTMVLERLVDVLCLGIIVLILISTQAEKFWSLRDEITKMSAAAASKYQIDPTLKYGDETSQFAHFVEAQTLWDRAMAEGIAQFRRARPATLVVGILARAKGGMAMAYPTNSRR